MLFWANMGRKSQSILFCLKIGTQGNLEELILHPDLVFQNSEPRTYSWGNLGQKIQSCPFFLKVGTEAMLEELILDPDLFFNNSNPKIHF